MEELYSPKVISELLKKYQLAPLKKLGQNFLRDENIVNKIAQAAVQPGENALEIGPGLGVLTQALARRAKKVVAVEIDKGMVQVLSQTLDGLENTQVLWQDFLKADLQEIAREHFSGEPFAVVGNLPYYITSKCLLAVLEAQAPVLRFTAMVQKEVADRMQVGPGTKDYGALSLAVQYYAAPEIVAIVPPNCFMPRPKVGSAVIRLTRHKELPVQVEDEKLMFRIIRASFNQRRKTLANGLKNSGELTLSKEVIEESITELGVPVTIRGEALSLAQFAELSNIILKKM